MVCQDRWVLVTGSITLKCKTCQGYLVFRDQCSLNSRQVPCNAGVQALNVDLYHKPCPCNEVLFMLLCMLINYFTNIFFAWTFNCQFGFWCVNNADHNILIDWNFLFFIAVVPDRSRSSCCTEPQSRMSGIEIHPVDGGDPIEIPLNKTTVGRGAFLKVLIIQKRCSAFIHVTISL